MNEKTKASFEATITSLLTASRKNRSKGNSVKEWFSELFNEQVSVARITENKQLVNRINEQFVHGDSIVVFVIEPDVNKENLIKKIRGRQYLKLLTVLVVENNPNGYYSYERLLYKKKTDFVLWAEQNLMINSNSLEELEVNLVSTNFSHPNILAAIRAKPFILLAGMSGTGKTRIVRQLARGCCPTDCDLVSGKPGNYECIPVRPNWHDSTELMGYITRITDDRKPKYVITDFVRFLAKAWLYEEKGIPFFLCLDEMNLAPVEQYFAEYLSVIESRAKQGDAIKTDPLIRIADERILKATIDDVYHGVEHEIAEKFKKFFVEQGGIPIPSNFIVMGTVNMDESTYSFSRKVLDRAMTFELNEVDMGSGLEENPEIEFGSISLDDVRGNFTHGWQVYAEEKDACDKIKDYLIKINKVLDKTPFKFAYRTRDEVMAYCVERKKDGSSLAEALDEATSMKILSRIEGDEQLISKEWLDQVNNTVEKGLQEISEGSDYSSKVCSAKLEEMRQRLQTGFTSFWT